MDSGIEETLGCINIADTDHYMIIHECNFYADLLVLSLFTGIQY